MASSASRIACTSWSFACTLLCSWLISLSKDCFNILISSSLASSASRIASISLLLFFRDLLSLVFIPVISSFFDDSSFFIPVIFSKAFFIFDFAFSSSALATFISSSFFLVFSRDCSFIWSICLVCSAILDVRSSTPEEVDRFSVLMFSSRLDMITLFCSISAFNETSTSFDDFTSASKPSLTLLALSSKDCNFNCFSFALASETLSFFSCSFSLVLDLFAMSSIDWEWDFFKIWICSSALSARIRSFFSADDISFNAFELESRSVSSPPFTLSYFSLNSSSDFFICNI